MKLLPDKNLLEEENPLLKKLTPIALHIACRGLVRSDSKRLIAAAAVSILTSPIGWAISVAKKALHLAIAGLIWWFVRGDISALGLSPYTALVLAIIVILYRELYAELVDLLLNILILITNGQFLKWACRGYLAGDGARQFLFDPGPLSSVVGVFVNVMPHEYRREYEEVINLYLDSNQPPSAERLNHLLDNYSLEDPGK